MPSNVEWIKEALERDPSKSRAGIAAALGVDRSAVTRLLSGERQLKLHEAEKIADYLGAPRPLGLTDRERDFAHPAAAKAGGARRAEDAPIYRAVAGRGGVWTIMRDEEPIDWRARAPHFEQATKVFGFYAPDDSMAPRFKSGETVWVDPLRPATPGDDALFVAKTTGRAPQQMILAELKSASDEDYTYIQYKDGAEQRLSRRKWSAIHVLPRY